MVRFLRRGEPGRVHLVIDLVVHSPVQGVDVGSQRRGIQSTAGLVGLAYRLG
jgi:hypothetical protein